MLRPQKHEEHTGDCSDLLHPAGAELSTRREAQRAFIPTGIKGLRRDSSGCHSSTAVWDRASPGGQQSGHPHHRSVTSGAGTRPVPTCPVCSQAAMPGGTLRQGASRSPEGLSSPGGLIQPCGSHPALGVSSSPAGLIQPLPIAAAWGSRQRGLRRCPVQQCHLPSAPRGQPGARSPRARVPPALPETSPASPGLPAPAPAPALRGFGTGAAARPKGTLRHASPRAGETGEKQTLGRTEREKPAA